MEASDAVRCSRSRNRWRQAACPPGEDASRQRPAWPDPQCPRPGKGAPARGLCRAAATSARRGAYAPLYRRNGNPDMGRPARPAASTAGASLANPFARVHERAARGGVGRGRKTRGRDPQSHDHQPSQGARRELPTNALRADPQRAPRHAAAAAPAQGAHAVHRRRAAGDAGPGHHAARAAAARAHAAGDSGTAVARGESGAGARAARDAAADGVDAACAATRRAEDDEVNEVQLAQRLR